MAKIMTCFSVAEAYRTMTKTGFRDSGEAAPKRPTWRQILWLGILLCLPLQLLAGSYSLLTAFGNNPGQLRGWLYLPANLQSGAPVVVAMHGCQQNARDYAGDSGWVQLADRFGVALVLPEQNFFNNPYLCFNWFNPGDSRRDQGEAASIMQMTDHAIARYQLDSKRLYVTGLSAGGAMTAVMLAIYPDRFAAGAILAGVPFRCTDWPSAAWACLAYGNWWVFSAQGWGDRVRDENPYPGPWPRVSIWQGQQDPVVNKVNAKDLVAQWTDLLGIDQEADVTTTAKGHTTLSYQDQAQRTLVEYHQIDGMGHGVPVDPQQDCGTDRSFPEDYMFDRDLCSTRLIAEFWGLVPDPGR